MQRKDYLQCNNLLRKNLFVLLFVLVMNSSLFAASGSFWGKKNLRVTKTQWFDIIYLSESQQTAVLLYQNADKIFDEVAEVYGCKPWFRMPLVITPTVDKLNAFWTSAPYNHIVIYDTSIDEVGELSVYSDTLFSIFKHELTHAITYNLRNNFWDGVSKIFGDAFTPGMLMVSTGIAEGAALTGESMNGEGRLNDEYSKQTVKQAKLENKFPSYYDVKGAADRYPVACSYYFNGAFHQWLQNKYGMEAYASFWFNVINIKKIFINSCFKKSFGISIRKAWKQFYSEYQVPEISAINTEEITNSKTNHRPVSLTKSEDKLAWIDEVDNGVYILPLNKNSSGEKLKPEKIFTISDICEINLSSDGRFLAITCLSGNSPGISSRIKIYDFRNKKFFCLPQSGLKNAAIVQRGQTYFVIANTFQAAKNKITLWRINLSDEPTCSEISSVNLVDEKTQNLNTFFFYYTPLSDGNFACVKKEGLEYSIVVQNTDNLMQEKEYDLGKNKIVPGSLSADGSDLYFSWTEPGSMPRFAKINLETQTVEFSNSDISGGIYEPVFVNNQLFYTGHFYTKNSLFKSRIEDILITDSQQISVQISEKTREKKQESNTVFTDHELEYTKYNPFKYLKRGLLLPFSLYQTEYFGYNLFQTTQISSYPLGFTYITGSPWTNGENDLLTVSTGWNYLNNSFGVDIKSIAGTETPLLSVSLDLKNEFDSDGWKFSKGEVLLQSRLNFGKISSVSFGDRLSVKIGRQDDISENYSLFDEFRWFDSEYFNCIHGDGTNYFDLENVFKISYSNVHRAGTNRFSKAGLTASVSFSYLFDKALTDYSQIYYEDFEIFPCLKAYIPCLLPFESDFALNLPSVVSFNLLPASSTYGLTQNTGSGRSIFDLQTETILFGTEIQKAVPGISAIYLNAFFISLGYNMTLAAGNVSVNGFQFKYLGDYVEGIFTGKANLLDSVYLKTSLELTPNIGVLSTSGYKTNIYSMLALQIHSGNQAVLPFQFYFGIQSNF